MIYGHGDDIFRYGDKIKLNFSSNVFSWADLSGLKEHLMQHFEVVSHYPESEPSTLEKMLAEHLDVPEDTVMVTSGAIEAIHLIAQLYKNWASIIPQPTFNAYEFACKTFDHLISYDRKDQLEVMPEDRIYWICNPNNPTGNVLVKPLVNRIIRQNPRYLYVIDQSFADYTLRPMLQPREMVDCYNMMLIGSLSKKYCIPGLRLGYIFSSPIIIDRLRQIRQPWTVNAMAIEAGKYLVTNNPQMIPDLPGYLAEAQRLRSELASIEGIKVLKTDTNFMLVFIDFADVMELKNWLIEKYGILIRDASDFRGLDNHYFRIVARTEKDDNQLVAAIREFKKWKDSNP
jgi:threonine-phosphate decarboxylase